MSTAQLIIGSASELRDLIAWCPDHAKDPLTEEWLRWIDTPPRFCTWPLQLAIPSGIAEDLEALIDDWCEVLSSHDEDEAFETRVVYAAAVKAS